MKTKLIIAAGLILGVSIVSCQDNVEKQPALAPVVAPQPTSSDSALSNAEEDYVVLYAVIADTGYSYFELDKRMYDISSSLKITVDTMGRFYDTKKKKIVLSDTDEDEMYRGQYFPRRFPSSYLSMEYYETYSNDTSGELMAICAGLFENETDADSVLTSIRSKASKAFKVPARMYLGCMH